MKGVKEAELYGVNRVVLCQSMFEDIREIRKIGANGIVIRPLTNEGKIDKYVLQALLYEATD